MSLALLFHYLLIAQHVSNVTTSIFRSLRLTVDLLLWFDVCLVLRCGSAGVVWYPYAG